MLPVPAGAGAGAGASVRVAQTAQKCTPIFGGIALSPSRRSGVRALCLPPARVPLLRCCRYPDRPAPEAAVVQEPGSGVRWISGSGRAGAEYR